jgi:accessory gene regulator protein AgrB
MSSLTFPLLAWLALRLPTVSALPLAVGTLVFALIAVLLFAPVDNEARPIRPEQRPRFRIASLVVLGLWGLVVAIGPKPEYVLAISAGLAWQSLSLTPAGRFWYHGIDGIFSLVEGGDKV